VQLNFISRLSPFVAVCPSVCCRRLSLENPLKVSHFRAQRRSSSAEVDLNKFNQCKALLRGAGFLVGGLTGLEVSVKLFQLATLWRDGRFQGYRYLRLPASAAGGVVFAFAGMVGRCRLTPG